MIGFRRIARALAVAAMLGLPTMAVAQPTGERVEAILDRIDAIRDQIRIRPGGVLGIMGYNMSPDGSANALQINRSTVSADEGASTFTLSQFGFGFTWSESFPLFTEAYVGTARYDPRAVFTNLGTRRSPLRWNNIAATLGVGYDIRIGEYLWLRPILNVSGGYAASDASLFGQFIQYRTDRDISALTGQHVNVGGLGGSLMLAYYDYRPARDIDVELRYTQIQLQTLGDTIRAARGRSTAQTASLWTRYRWPTGWEAFGRPVRWVLDGSFSYYLGDQADIMGFTWSAKVGGGIEIDVGRQEFGALGLNLSRVRLVARYFIGDNNITGTSVGIGMSF
ncbi:hypothetical protein DFH01_25640 [Falsiroseomonas bella]|uniref:Autotransporter domain-containing protein n=1 Tax=Falsiroseomonas bella TaxID=2184016 RepID=A0A317F7G0_9PROT|nr:hypothetical protein [Falsiroseomonas bella]PWS34402.1 hypothetical protein DFH01_25640 [Falsiroseomonas bella]